MMCSREDVIRQYSDDGVIRVRGLFPVSRMAEIREAIDRYVQGTAPTLPASDVVFESDGRSVRNLWRMDKHAPFFAELAGDEQLRGLIRELLNHEPVLVGVETFNKPAKVGSGVPPHQDNAYFCHSPPDLLTVWIAIDPVTTANGPVFYVRGSHRDGMRMHKPSGVKGNSMGLDGSFDDSDPFVGTLDPGDALIHHCQIIHYSGPNTTDDARCGLLMVFRGENTQADPSLKAQYVLGGAVA